MIYRLVLILTFIFVHPILMYGGGPGTASALDGWVAMGIAILGMIAFLKIMFGQKEEQNTINDDVQ